MNIPSLFELAAVDSVAKARALAALGIHTIRDMAEYDACRHAQYVLAAKPGAGNGAGAGAGADTDAAQVWLGYYLDASALATADLEALGELDIGALKSVTEADARVLRSAFGVATVDALARFAPFEQARQLVLDSVRGAFFEKPSAPRALIPQLIGSTHEQARFASYVKEVDHVLDDCALLHLSDLDEPEPDGALIEIFTRARFGFALGYLACLHQTWTSAGTHLGEIVHSLALAPGESRNIAVLDWYRRQASARDEATTVSEQLRAQFTQTRALNEVVQTTAREHLAGATEIDATTRTTGLGAVAGNASGASAGASGSADLTSLIGLPVSASGGALGSTASSLGASAVYANGTVQGTLKSETGGERTVAGRLAQDITDATVQNASNVRSVMSTVVVEDRQSGRQRAQTSNVTNYNHSHALTVQYYEVLHRYRVDTSVASLAPMLYLPFAPLAFDIALIQRYWYLLGGAIKRLRPQRHAQFDQVVRDFNPNNEAFDASGDLRVTRVRITRSRTFSEPVRVSFYEADPVVTLAVAGIGDLDGSVALRITGSSDYAGYDVLALPAFDVDSFFAAGSTVDSFELDEGIKLRLSSDFMVELRRMLKVYLNDEGRTPHAPVGSSAANLADNELGVHSKRDNLLAKVDDGKFSLLNGSATLDLTLNAEYTVVDRNGQEQLVPRSIHKTYTFGVLWNEIAEDIDDVTAQVDAYLGAVADINPAEVVAEIEQYFAFHKYGFTKYLLANLEKEQIKDIVEHLGVQGQASTLSLAALIDPIPVALTENLLVFRVREDAQRLRTQLARNFSGSIRAPLFGKRVALTGHGTRQDAMREGRRTVKYRFHGQPIAAPAAGGFTTADLTLHVDASPGQDGEHAMVGSVDLVQAIGLRRFTHRVALRGAAPAADGEHLQIGYVPQGAVPAGGVDPAPGTLDWTLAYPAPAGPDAAEIVLGYTQGLHEYEGAIGLRHLRSEVFLPSAGVFAEAILGLSNASEYLDVRRFFNWQDSPIPNVAPAIGPVDVNQDMAQPVPGALSPTVPASVLNQILPQSYPMPASLGAALQAVQNGSMFADMSKSAELTSILASLASLANNTAQLSGNLAGDAAANALDAALALGQQVASMVGAAMGTNVADAPRTLTQQGTAVNHLEDVQAHSGGGAISPTDQAAANGMGTPIPGSMPAGQTSGGASGEVAGGSTGGASGDQPGGAPGESSIFPDLEIRLRLFIPAEVVTIPPPMVDALRLVVPTGTGVLLEEAVKYSVGGDNRGFSYDQGGHRCQAVVNVSMDPARGARAVDAVIPFADGRLAQIAFGSTHIYREQHIGAATSPLAVCGAGSQPWAYALVPGSVADSESTLPATPDHARVEFEGNAASTLTVRFRISAALAAPDAWTLDRFAPAIDGDIKVRLENIGLSGKVRCYVDASSRHDGFPAWELYVDGQRLYAWAPCHVYGPLGLYGPSLAEDAGLFSQILASVGEDVLFVRPGRHELEAG